MAGDDADMGPTVDAVAGVAEAALAEAGPAEPRPD